jgi:hypothetical protein
VDKGVPLSVADGVPLAVPVRLGEGEGVEVSVAVAVAVLPAGTLE